MARPQNEVWLTCTDIRRIFGITPGRLKRRGVQSRGESPVEYDLEDFWAKFGAEISPPSATNPDAGGWKERKLKAEALGLEMRNAKDAGDLVPADAIKPAFTVSLGAMADVLGSTTSRIRRRKPDIDSAVLAVVEECLNEARNEAASIDFSKLISAGNARN